MFKIIFLINFHVLLTHFLPLCSFLIKSVNKGIIIIYIIGVEDDT